MDEHENGNEEKQKWENLVMFWNVKTTGFPQKTSDGKFYSPDQYTKYNFSRVVGLSWIIVSDNLSKEITRGAVLINPSLGKNSNKCVMRQDATKVHGITEKMIQDNGISFHELIEGLSILTSAVKHIVGHCVEFDKNVFLAECYRNEETAFLKTLETQTKFHCSILQYQMVTNEYKTSLKLIQLCEKLHVDFIDKSKEELCCECFKALIQLPSGFNPFAKL